MAPWRRSGRKTYEFQAVLRDGSYRQLSTGTSGKALARQMEDMWNILARRHRAWDVLDRVLAKGSALTVATLYDHWVEAEQHLSDLRRRLEDVDVATKLDGWLLEYRVNVEPDSADHAATHLRWLFADSPLLASAATTAYLARRLAEYPGKRNTKRKVHSSWSVFFAWLEERGVLSPSPMLKVARPSEQRAPLHFHDQPEAERLVAAQPSPERRAFFALSYGAAGDVSSLLPMLRTHVDAPEQSVRIIGTKGPARDRIVRVADWAWPYVAAVLTDKLPQARLFPDDWNRYTLSDWHRETAAALQLPPWPLRNARHHWAVMQVRAGAPIRLVADGLGHTSDILTLKTYGRYAVNAEDRRRWAAVVAKDLKRRASGT